MFVPSNMNLYHNARMCMIERDVWIVSKFFFFSFLFLHFYGPLIPDQHPQMLSKQAWSIKDTL